MNCSQKYSIMLCAVLYSVTVAAGCAKPVPLETVYHVTERQLPPEKVYGVTTWNHPSSAAPAALDSEAPFIQPSTSNVRHAATVREATREVARILGYRAECEEVVCEKRVSIPLDGTASEIVSAIEIQGGAVAEVNIDTRIVRVRESAPAPASTIPMLPPANTIR